MTDKVFSITGNKISSFIIDDSSLKFSSQKFNTASEFLEAWNKKVSLATKVEVKFDSIKSIEKEDKDEDILIKYKTLAGIPLDCEFSFYDSNDYEIFFNFIEKKWYFKRTHETLTPLRAIRNFAIGLVATIGITVLSYNKAIDVENGRVEETSSGQIMAFNYLVGLLGDKGVIAVGSLVASFLLYKIWTRFTNPPNQTKFLPPYR